MSESVETARAVRADDRTSNASREDVIDTPHGQSRIHIQEIWVGSRELSKNSEVHLIQC